MSLEVDLVAYNIVRASWKLVRPEALQVDHSVAALAYSYFSRCVESRSWLKSNEEVSIVEHVFVCLFPVLDFCLLSSAFNMVNPCVS